MKAIIQSYTPQECKRIINGRQTIKVCKTVPKETPFKVYIYCTKDGYAYRCRIDENSKLAIPELWNGKVIGEYVCEKVDIAKEQVILGGIYYSRYEDVIDCLLVEKRCLDNSELSNYGRGKPISCLYISNVKIYDKPKELKEFNFTRPPHGWQYVEELQ